MNPLAKRSTRLIAGAFLLFVALVVAAGWGLPRRSLPLGIWQAEIERRLARGEGRRAWNDIVESTDWEGVLARIRAGEPSALQLAVVLCDVADTHPGEEMFDAMAASLASNPAWLLNNGKRCRVGLRNLCSWPPSEEPDAKAMHLVLDRRAKAVGALDDARTEEARSECLAGIGEARRWVVTTYGGH